MKQYSRIFFLLLFLAGIYLNSEQLYAQESASKDKYLIEAQAFKSSVEKKKNIIIVDVRTPEEYDESHIKGAINIDFKDSSFLEEIEKLDKSKKYYIYCRSGKRSANSRKIMNEAGIRKVYDLDGGIRAWKSNNFPVID